MSITSTAAWQKLIQYQAGFTQSLRQLHDENPKRCNDFSFAVDGLTVDLSYCHLNRETLSLLLALAEQRAVATERDQMLSGAKINHSENRAVLHTALRADPVPALKIDDVDIGAAITSMQRQMQALVTKIRDGHWLGATGKPIRHIVNLGIGGSDLGPRLAASALRDFTSGPKLHFVANVDAVDLLDTLRDLDPAETLFIVVSKSFATEETLLNAKTARQWLVQRLGQAAVARHFIAVSTNPAAMQDFGIDPAHALPLWDWVGGRFSLWSAVGLSLACATGWDHFRQLLAGATSMDRHFVTAPLSSNLPVLLAMTSIWYRNFWDTHAEAVLPYSERLRELPRWRQQLEMESNGKSVTRQGQPVNYATAPMIIGECGTIGQHSFHQWLHQGTDLVLAEFIGIKEDQAGQPEHHQMLWAHQRAQAEALAFGNNPTNPAARNPGNRPSLTLTLERLDPYHLGQLLALYEHKVFVEGIVWDINSFDQFGVELGKRLATHKPMNSKA